MASRSPTFLQTCRSVVSMSSTLPAHNASSMMGQRSLLQTLPPLLMLSIHLSPLPLSSFALRGGWCCPSSCCRSGCWRGGSSPLGPGTRLRGSSFRAAGGGVSPSCTGGGRGLVQLLLLLLAGSVLPAQHDMPSAGRQMPCSGLQGELKDRCSLQTTWGLQTSSNGH